jgi:hypothetical protein
VPPKRVGTVIACPRCGTELLVPRPEEEPTSVATGQDQAGSGSRPRPRAPSAQTSPRPEAGSVPSFLDEVAAAIPEDLVALRPEDIRVEAEFADLVVTTDELATPVPRDAKGLDLHTAEPLAAPLTAETILPQAPDASQPPPAGLGERPAVDAALGAVLPEITIEPPTILPPGRAVGPVREVVLQPEVVFIWSLVILLSLPLAFLAGLLIGHFLWKAP